MESAFTPSAHYWNMQLQSYTRRMFSRSYVMPRGVVLRYQSQALREAASESCRPCLARSSLLGCFQTYRHRRIENCISSPANAAHLTAASHYSMLRTLPLRKLETLLVKRDKLSSLHHVISLIADRQSLICFHKSALRGPGSFRSMSVVWR